VDEGDRVAVVEGLPEFVLSVGAEVAAAAVGEQDDAVGAGVLIGP
jgi:hypothetical protein